MPDPKIAQKSPYVKAMPAGTYTAWPFARVTVDTVTHPDGSADAAPEGDRIVVGFPTQVTFTD